MATLMSLVTIEPAVTDPGAVLGEMTFLHPIDSHLALLGRRRKARM